MKIKSVSGRSENQKNYIKKIQSNDIILCHGNPGTGKTFIAVGMAICELAKDATNKVVFTRPVVSVGREIGYLPGKIDEKLGPFVQPLYDAALNFLTAKELREYERKHAIEICPINMMRGRTFKDCYVIVDEAQNCTTEEIKAILTRLGENAKIIMAGDVNQSDLESRFMIKEMSGMGDYVLKVPFAECIDRLFDVGSVGVATLGKEDIQRNKVIGEIEELLSDW